MQGTGVDATQTAFDVDDGTYFTIGDTLVIDNERMTVTNIVGNTLSVTRGVDGTTATSHADNPMIGIDHVTPPVQAQTMGGGSSLDTTLGTDPATCPMTTEQLYEKCKSNTPGVLEEFWPKLVEANGGSEEDISKAALTKFLSGIAKLNIMELFTRPTSGIAKLNIMDELQDSITSNQAIVTELINSLDLTLPKVTTAVFNLFDKDHDGVITKREFFWFWAHTDQLLNNIARRGEANTRAELYEFVFDFISKLLDENGNGTIEANEVGAFIRTILEFGANIAKLLLGIIPKVLDSPDVNLAEHIGKVFSVLDVDHGGTLSLKELTAPFDDPTSISDPFFQGQIAPTLGMIDAAIFTNTNGMKEAEEAISAIAGLPAGTFLDASEAMKAEFMECAVGGKVAKDVAVNILLKHQYAPITKLIDALKGIVMQHAEAPHSQLSARFTSSLRTGIDSFEQWLVGGGMKGCMMAACDLFDANGDGMISIDELEEMFTKPQSMSEMLTLLFSIGDADGDGELTKDEVMGLVHRYVNLLVAVMELMIDVYVETALAVAKPLLTAILEAYESPLGFTMETVRVLVNEGPEAGAGRLQILATHCQITAMNAMQSVAMRV